VREEEGNWEKLGPWIGGKKDKGLLLAPPLQKEKEKNGGRTF